MAKYYGTIVKTGKVGGSVFAIRNGICIERQYQPVVLDTKSDAQVASRARLKLMSQLSAVFGQNVAIPRQGMASPRNMFVKKNYELSSYNTVTSSADVDMLGLQITDSAIAFPDVLSTREASIINVQLTVSPGADILKVVYVLVSRNGDKLHFEDAKVVDTSADVHFPTSFYLNANVGGYVYAYGVRALTQEARVTYGQLTNAAATTIAKILVTKSYVESGLQATVTRSTQVTSASQATSASNKRQLKS